MKTILYFLKPYKGLFALTMFFTIADVVGALIIPTLTADMINIGVGSGNMGYILETGAMMVAVTLLSGLSALLGSFLCARLSAKMGRDMRNRLYAHSLEFSVNDFEAFGAGSMITRTLNDVSVVQQAFVWCVQLVLPVPALAAAGIFMAFRVEPSMGVLLGAAVVFVLLLTVAISRRAAAIFTRMQHFLDRMNVILRENITGVRVIRAFNKEGHERKRMGRSFEDYAQAAIQTNYLFAFLDCFSFFVINLVIVAILWAGGNRIGAGAMEIGDITALTEYAILILFYLMMAQMVLILLPRARVCLGRIEEVLNRRPEIRDLERTDERGEGTKDGPAVQFENVSFRFADAQEDTLEGICFSCPRGQTTAIIGGTGSGKSTIAKLLLRFYDVTEGAVRLNGRDVRSMTQRELRERIAYVPQKAWLFSGTIRDNLRYGNEAAAEEDMIHALQTAQSGFALELKDGLESHVAQGGTNFSGGQKQRLSIARALMKQADVYVFDDSFSALDFKTDRALRRALGEEIRDSAVIIIAQRINTILNAGQIIVLNEGRIAGIGTHQELMESCSVYQEIARSQMKGESGQCLRRKS